MQINGKIVCITGILPVPRRVAAEMITKTGGVFATHVTKRTDILVVGTFPRGITTTAKYTAATKWIARGHPITLMSPSEFLSSIEQ